VIEKHPFADFVPKNANYLILGSFIARPVPKYNFYYANGRNQFWPILEEIYQTRFKTNSDQQKLLTKLKIAITDIISSCERKKDSSMDVHLTNITFNSTGITNILKYSKIKKIYFTSVFVEKLFKKEFKDAIVKYPDIELITLPSPSPRYALMTKSEKIFIYKKLLPKY